MFNVNNPHQFFEADDDNGVMVCRWTMDKIKRKDGKVWLMNHFFINPSANKAEVLEQEMRIAMLVAQESNLKIWPLDPLIIAYFAEHPAFDQIWYHRPCAN